MLIFDFIFVAHAVHITEEKLFFSPPQIGQCSILNGIIGIILNNGTFPNRANHRHQNIPAINFTSLVDLPIIFF